MIKKTKSNFWMFFFNLLKQIETLYNKFENYIITMDIKHLHKL